MLAASRHTEESLARELRLGIVEARRASAVIGAARARAELQTLGLRIEAATENLRNVVQDVRQAARIAKAYAKDWVAEARLTSPTEATRKFSYRLRRIATTDSAKAYNEARTETFKRVPRKRVRLLRVWDSELDKQTCDVCAHADGTIVGVNQRFPLGEPGGLHPNCRCGFSLLRSDEVGSDVMITPVAA